MDIIYRLPIWVRWLLLVPASLAGGFLAGYSVYLLNSSQVATPDAPIVFIAEFLGGFASNLVAFEIAHAMAPARQRLTVIAFIFVALVASASATYLDLRHEDYRGLLTSAGNVLACVIAWRKFVSVNE